MGQGKKMNVAATAVLCAVFILLAGVALGSEASGRNIPGGIEKMLEFRDYGDGAANARGSFGGDSGEDDNGGSYNDAEGPSGTNSDSRNSDGDSDYEIGDGNRPFENIREKIGKMKDNYEEAKRKAKEARENAKSGLELFGRMKEKLRVSAPNLKDGLRENMRNSAQHVLLNQVSAILHQLDAIEGKRAEPGDFNALKSFFEAKQQLLADGNMAKESLIALSQEIRDYWRSQRPGIEKEAGENLNEKFGNIVSRAEGFSAKIAADINRLKSQGKDASLLETGLAKLNADINGFKAASAQVRADLNAVSGANGSDANSMAKLREARELLKKMHRQLQVDFKLMKSLFKATRWLNSSQELSDEIKEELGEGLGED